MLLRGGMVATFSPVGLERADLRLDDGKVAERGPDLDPRDGEEVVDASRCLITPGLVCAHTHFYSALARGMPPPDVSPTNFLEILERVWWRLDRALDPDLVRLSAEAGAIDALSSGVTTVIDHHASPRAIEGSLTAVADALSVVGLRGVLAYEVTDRNGLDDARAGIEEHRRFAPRVSDRLGLLVGAHASFTLSDGSLEGVVEAARDLGTGLHIHVAEDLADVEDARKRGFRDPVERLFRAGALGAKTVLAHGVHLGEGAMEEIAAGGSWIVVNPRSNMNNAVGTAPFSIHPERHALGTDGIGADMLEEVRALFFRASDSGQGLSPDAALGYLGGSQRLAGEILGPDLHSLQPGATADVAVFMYDPPTVLEAANLAAHVVFGLRTAALRRVVVAGETVWRDGACTRVHEAESAGRFREGAARLWGRMAGR